MSRGRGRVGGLSAAKSEDAGLVGASSASGGDISVDARLSLVLEAGEGVEVELEQALPVLRADDVGDQEAQELAFVVRRMSEGTKAWKRRHDERRRGSFGSMGGGIYGFGC